MPVQPRLGFCCKYLSDDPVVERRTNIAAVTIAYLSRQEPRATFEKLLSVVRHNLLANRLQVEHVASRPPIERLHRMSSDLLPAYTHPIGSEFYRDADVRALIERELAATGALARKHGVRLSMHPDQFCVIASQSPGASENGITEFEYHAEIMSLMGFGSGWHPQGAHINIHAGARSVGAEGFRAGLARLSEAARNLITVENDEVSYGLDDLLPLGDALPIVLDLHHHWIASGGEYVEPGDPRIGRIVESWRGERPMSHISLSRETLLHGHDPQVRPNFSALTAAGIKARDLRGHSDLVWNEAVADLVADHLSWTDFEVEAKLKNRASELLARHVERRWSDAAEGSPARAVG